MIFSLLGYESIYLSIYLSISTIKTNLINSSFCVSHENEFSKMTTTKTTTTIIIIIIIIIITI